MDTQKSSPKTHINFARDFKKLQNSNECDVFCTALYAYEKINCFLLFVVIDNYETVNQFLVINLFTAETEQRAIGDRMIDEFERITKILYEAGMKTFLTDLVSGDHETLYAHAMRW